MTIAHKGNFVALVEKLRDLANNGFAFRRCVITTHGYPGRIKFGSDGVSAGGLRNRCAGQGLDRLFLFPNSRLYFNGCGVGAEPGGKEFVTAAT